MGREKRKWCSEWQGDGTAAARRVGGGKNMQSRLTSADSTSSSWMHGLPTSAVLPAC